MCYIFVDGDIYLGMSNNNYVPIKDKESARKFSNEKEAKNIFNSCVPKILRKNYAWNLEEVEEKINLQYTPVDFNEVKRTISDLSEKFSTLQGNKEWLLEQQSNYDKQISDILHFIEFNSFSACEGYKLCKALKELRLQRRDVKNELELIDIIGSNTCNNIASGHTSKALNSIENKQYAPRVLTELFENRKINDIISKS